MKKRLRIIGWIVFGLWNLILLVLLAYSLSFRENLALVILEVGIINEQTGIWTRGAQAIIYVLILLLAVVDIPVLLPRLYRAWRGYRLVSWLPPPPPPKAVTESRTIQARDPMSASRRPSMKSPLNKTQLVLAWIGLGLLSSICAIWGITIHDSYTVTAFVILTFIVPIILLLGFAIVVAGWRKPH